MTAQLCVPCLVVMGGAGEEEEHPGLTMGPAGPWGTRHSESAAVESEDQHEREMETKEQ